MPTAISRFPLRAALGPEAGKNRLGLVVGEEHGRVVGEEIVDLPRDGERVLQLLARFQF